jgi:hypothetical protein
MTNADVISPMGATPRTTKWPSGALTDASKLHNVF